MASSVKGYNNKRQNINSNGRQRCLHRKFLYNDVQKWHIYNVIKMEVHYMRYNHSIHNKDREYIEYLLVTMSENGKSLLTSK